MVSTMRSEQTLRLIQLYHANYPDIARNNQDADGRNLKLQMWAQITDELNRTFETAFTVEQFKKKVQNVQCTSRQKLYSGKRNLGEAEVEYLRLFESDKISEETLTQRAKTRRSVSLNSSADFLMLRERHIGGINLIERDDKEEEDEPEEEGSEGGGTEEANGHTRGGTETAEDGESAASALQSLSALFASSGATECPQLLDNTQHLLWTMLNATLNGMGGTDVAGTDGGAISGVPAGTDFAEDGGRKRKVPSDVIDGEIGIGGNCRRDPKRARTAAGKAVRHHSIEENRIECTKSPSANEVKEEREGEDSWRAEMLQIQRRMLNQQRQMIAQLGVASMNPRGAPQTNSSSSSSTASPSLPPSSSSSFTHCQCSLRKNGGGGSGQLSSLERELCTRLDTMNARLATIVELILQRLPLVPTAESTKTME